MTCTYKRMTFIKKEPKKILDFQSHVESKILEDSMTAFGITPYSPLAEFAELVLPRIITIHKLQSPSGKTFDRVAVRTELCWQLQERMYFMDNITDTL